MRTDFVRHVRRLAVIVGLVVGGILVAAVPDASASFIYTFSDTDSTPYSFSFEVPSILTADADPLAVTPIVTSNGLTITDATLDVINGTSYCFSFAGGPSGKANMCGYNIGSFDFGVGAIFPGANMVGTFVASVGAADGIGDLEQLVISESTTAPEPASLLLLATGGVGYVISRRRRQPAKH